MTAIEQITDYANNNGGYFLSKNAKDFGISREALSRFVMEGYLERPARGVYLLPEYFGDEMYYLQQKSPKIIYSHGTSLYLFDLTDRDPLRFDVTVPKGYNTHRLKEYNIDSHYVKPEFYKLGVSEAKTIYGNIVKTYDVERTLCDIIKPRAKMDIAMLTDAYKRYARQKGKNINKLMKYAQLLGVTEKVRKYMEVLL